MEGRTERDVEVGSARGELRLGTKVAPAAFSLLGTDPRLETERGWARPDLCIGRRFLFDVAVVPAPLLLLLLWMLLGLELVSVEDLVSGSLASGPREARRECARGSSSEYVLRFSSAFSLEDRTSLGSGERVPATTICSNGKHGVSVG